MQNHLRFNNPALRDTASKVVGDMAEFRARLDSISADIKEIEKWLNNAGFCVPFSIEISYSSPICNNDPELDTSFYRESELLEWAERKNGWRLLYTRSKGYGDLLISDRASDWHEEDQRPLIEADAATRLKCDKYLPDFVEKAVSLLPKVQRRSIDVHLMN